MQWHGFFPDFLFSPESYKDPLNSEPPGSLFKQNTQALHLGEDGRWHHPVQKRFASTNEGSLSTMMQFYTYTCRVSLSITHIWLWRWKDLEPFGPRLIPWPGSCTHLLMEASLTMWPTKLLPCDEQCSNFVTVSLVTHLWIDYVKVSVKIVSGYMSNLIPTIWSLFFGFKNKLHHYR